MALDVQHTDETESIRTIHAALDRGITLIDTAVRGMSGPSSCRGYADAHGKGSAHARERERARLKLRVKVPTGLPASRSAG